MRKRLVMMATLTLAASLPITGCSYEQSRRPSPTAPVEYATADEARMFGDACFEHMKIYSKNRFKTSSFELFQVGEAKVSSDTRGCG